MKVGDLVKMKYEMWWKVRNRTRDYYKDCGLVYDITAKGFKVLMPDNSIKFGLVKQWEVIDEDF